ncbi:MAG: hypothetical protein V1821_00910 [bacterium]
MENSEQKSRRKYYLKRYRLNLDEAYDNLDLDLLEQYFRHVYQPDREQPLRPEELLKLSWPEFLGCFCRPPGQPDVRTSHLLAAFMGEGRSKYRELSFVLYGLFRKEIDPAAIAAAAFQNPLVLELYLRYGRWFHLDGNRQLGSRSDYLKFSPLELVRRVILDPPKHIPVRFSEILEHFGGINPRTLNAILETGFGVDNAP